MIKIKSCKLVVTLSQCYQQIGVAKQCHFYLISVTHHSFLSCVVNESSLVICRQIVHGNIVTHIAYQCCLICAFLEYALACDISYQLDNEQLKCLVCGCKYTWSIESSSFLHHSYLGLHRFLNPSLSKDIGIEN